MSAWWRKPGVLLLLLLASTLTFFCAALVTAWQVEGARAPQRAAPTAAAAELFGLERQFLRLRGELGAVLAAPHAEVAVAPFAHRYEMLAGRVRLLAPADRAAPAEVDVPAPLLAGLRALVREGDRIFAGAGIPRAQLAAWVDRMDALWPQVEAATQAGLQLAAQRTQQRLQALRRQAFVISLLAALQLVLLAVAVYAVWTRQRQHQQAQQEQQQLADELRDAKMAAESAARTKSQFLANMSHELRTPFQGVLGMLQLLQRTRLGPDQTELVQTARDSAHHLLQVLNDILDISAIEAGKVVLHPDPVDLHHLCRNVEGLMRVQAEARGLQFVARIDPALPQWVLGDATRIKQILFNLLNNAIKFTQEGEVRLEATARARPGGRQQLLFEVVDTGIGMDEETQARLFRRFEPGESGLSRRFGGTGLGLEISRNLAHLMGGDLAVHSAVGVGSRFALTLDLPDCPPPAAPAEAGVPQVSALRVLVADDHPINRRYLALVLASLGHTADLCENGEEAVEIVQCDRFDAVLMDVHMPVLDGLAATRRIRALGGHYAQLPILALTADVMAASRERALRAGVTAFVPKPVQMDQLARALAEAIAGGPQAQAAPASLSPRLLQVVGSLPREQVADLLRMFFEDESRALAELREAIFGGDPETIRTAAHKFKGSARMLGLNPVAESAETVEAWARAGAPADDALPRWQAVQGAVESARGALQGWLQPGEAQPAVA